MHNYVVHMESEEIVTKTVNDNGQIYLGRALAGKDVRIGYEVLESEEFVCDECAETFELVDVAVFNRGSDDERVVCTGCLTVEDRIIS